MAKEQDEEMRQKQIEANRKESADAARKQLNIPKKNTRDENQPPARDDSGR
jgi:hypothetical protein